MIKLIVLSPEVASYKKRALGVFKWLEKKLDEARVTEVYLVGNEKMNTNVLSYPAPDKFPRPDLKKETLGEIYLNPLYIKEKKESFEYMMIHGFLHLLGYDHKKKNDRITMEAKEDELLNELKQNDF